MNGKQISDEKFGQYVENSLEILDIAHEPIPFFRYMTVLAFHIFLKEAVDVAIIEVGIGGRFDCTNILEQPVVTGIISLSLEHTNLLGDSLEKIAWHKCGIFKPGSRAFIANQHPNVHLNDVCLNYASLSESYGTIVYADNNLKPGIPGSFQTLNSSLALAISKYWLDKDGSVDVKLFETNKDFLISQTQVFGRQHRLQVGKSTLFLDASHTLESIDDTVLWMKQESTNNQNLAVIIYCNPPRDPLYLFRSIITGLSPTVVFWIRIDKNNVEALEKFCVRKNSEFRQLDVESFHLNLLELLEAHNTVLACGSFYLIGEIYKGLGFTLEY